jgi:hypothetical protein
MNTSIEKVISQVYSFKGHAVRTAGTWDRPLFCAADVCAVLGIENSRDAVARLDAEDVELVSVEHASGGKQASYVTESGLYQLVMGSRKPEARPFKRWVTGEVLPSIRKYGYYSAIESELREQKERLLAEYFPNLPSYAEPLFSGLLDELLRRFGWCPAKSGPKVARKSNGAPPWGAQVAGWIYEWGIRLEGQQERRRTLNPATKVTRRGKRTAKPDYSMFSELARDTIERVTDTATRMVVLASTWQDWRMKMDLMYGTSSVRMAALPPASENQVAFGFLGSFNAR